MVGWRRGGGGVYGSPVPYKINMKNPGRWGALSEIPPVVGYGYFLEPHIA